MSSRQLHSKGGSDGLSLPATTRKGRSKQSNQQEMEQQQDQLQRATVQKSPLQNLPSRPASTQPTVGESAAPTTGQVDRSNSTLLQDTAVMLPPSGNMVPPARPGTSQVFFHSNNTQDSCSHMSQMSGPLFTEDRLSTSSSSDQEMCDQEVRNMYTCDVSKTWIQCNSRLLYTRRSGSASTFTSVRFGT